MKIDLILSRLEGHKQTGPGKWLARCPAHQDKSPSLSIAYREGRILLHCFAGCGADSVLGAIGLEFTDLFDHPPVGADGGGKRVSKFGGLTADDALRSLTFEAAIVGLAADDMANGVDISDDDLERVQLAAARIDAGREFIRGLHVNN